MKKTQRKKEKNMLKKVEVFASSTAFLWKNEIEFLLVNFEIARFDGVFVTLTFMIVGRFQTVRTC